MAQPDPLRNSGVVGKPAMENASNSVEAQQWVMPSEAQKWERVTTKGGAPYGVVR